MSGNIIWFNQISNGVNIDIIQIIGVITITTQDLVFFLLTFHV